MLYCKLLFLLSSSYHSHGGQEGRERIRSYEFYYPNGDHNGIYKFNVLLTTYNILMSDLDVLQDIHWKYMIVDEAQRAKSQNTKSDVEKNIPPKVGLHESNKK